MFLNVAPVRERGLKFPGERKHYSLLRRSREGAWIEIACCKAACINAGRRSREGAWIEIHTAIEAYGDGP